MECIVISCSIIYQLVIVVLFYRWIFQVGEHVEKTGKFKFGGKFEYNGFHYVPVRSFNQEEKDMSLKDISAYLRGVQGTLAGTVAYVYDKFYAASGNSKADIFYCVETEKLYIPCSNSLQEYQKKA